MCKEFNPDAFDFSKFIDTHKTKKRVATTNNDPTRSYILAGEGDISKKTGKVLKTMSLTITRDVADRITNEVGKKVDIGFDETGSFYIRKGNMRKLSQNPNGRLTISLDTYASEYFEIMGKFNRLYVEPVFGDVSIGFKPTGERD